MRSKRKAINFPVRCPLAAAVACGGEGSLHTPLLGGGRRGSIVERNLLSQFRGDDADDANLHVTTDHRPKPSLALSLGVGSEEEPPSPPPQNRLPYAPPTRRQCPGLLRAAGSSVQMYAPPGSSSPPGAGVLDELLPRQLEELSNNNNNSLIQQLQQRAPSPTPEAEPCCGACSLSYDHLLRTVDENLDRRVGLLRQELRAEVRTEVHAVAAAAGVPGVPAGAGAAAFSQHCGGGGAWRRCPACGTWPGTVVLKPYEHLCLCAQCASDGGRVCQHCSCFTWTETRASRGRGRGPGGRRGGARRPTWP